MKPIHDFLAAYLAEFFGIAAPLASVGIVMPIAVLIAAIFATIAARYL